MKIVIVAGGTGGHIYPGIAVAQAIHQRDPAAEILFVGSEEGLEKDLVGRAGFQIKLIRSRALLRKISYQAISAPFVSLIGFFQAVTLLWQFKPAKVLSTGGYASLPVVVAARLLAIPVFLHEQNVLPGVVNRLTRRLATHCFLTFAESEKYLTGEVTGNPVRRQIIFADRNSARRKFNLQDEKMVLVFGGSQGAQHLNQTIVEALNDRPKNIRIFHIAGKRDYNWVREATQGKGNGGYQLFNYVYDMADLLAAADVVVSRAGATAIAEFLVRGLPMILIPFPYAAEDHQRLNAAVMVSLGAAKMINDQELNKTSFWLNLNLVIKDYALIAKAAKSNCRLDAAERIVEKLYA
jgi:UDP-N-acetylglucosamine--N-acetylmuramyl-(pentapeptide) pyrophosphoryl-undecaprenol N-acetylglucosamine transferase